AATTLLLAVALEERRRALAALRESQVRFDAFVGHTPALILLKDFEGRALAASPSMEKLMGAAPGALVGTLAREWVSAELADRIEGEDRRVLETGEEVRREDVVRGHSLVSMKFRIPREGEPPLLGSIGLDVTELREAERALRLAQTALQRGYAAVLILDPGGRITYANEAAERLLGRPGAELRGRGLWEVDGAFDAPGWPDRFRALREGGPGVCRGAPTSPAGGRIEAEVQLSYLAFDGGEYVIYTARDLTDRRRAEVAERLAALGTLAAGVAHEINNPLTFVTANLAWAREQLERAPPDEPRTLALQALRDADEGSRRVARIVRDLGAVSRLPVGGRVPIDPRTEVGGALKLVQHQVRHRAGLVTRLEPVPPVRAAEFELGQVVVNLVVNAIHAIPEGEPERHEIRVATRTSPDGWAVVEVADTGHGIPEPLRGRIFEPFFTTKAVGEGTGLGLSVCHGLVTALGGRIEIESEPGRGSCFRVLLPPCLEAAPAAAPPPPDAGRRARVLVIDDEPQIGVAVRRILDDHEVTASADARAALRRLVGGERFDLILCDVMMPELSGVDLFEALAREAPDAAHRVVFITGGAFSERARRFLERSEAPRIDKPFASGELRALLAERLAQRAPAEARPGERG
ncbi:MAG TPA: ATP-binding protein, partial [Anaeromyxobacter sp.]|nr:ATP-binding protein [Anaeromyxobacter sp.]